MRGTTCLDCLNNLWVCAQSWASRSKAALTVQKCKESRTRQYRVFGAEEASLHVLAWEENQILVKSRKILECLFSHVDRAQCTVPSSLTKETSMYCRMSPCMIKYWETHDSFTKSRLYSYLPYHTCRAVPCYSMASTLSTTRPKSPLIFRKLSNHAFNSFSALFSRDLAESFSSWPSSLIPSFNEPAWEALYVKILETWTVPTRKRQKLTAAKLFPKC